MELRHLRTIAAVARHGSFTRAADELHLAQSAISQQIRRLEAELGCQVFRRTSRSVELTAEGRLVLDYAHRVLSEVEGLHNELEELSGLLRGDLKLGGMYPTGMYDLADVLADFHERHPGVKIHMLEDTQDELLAMLRADEIDAAFTAVDPDGLGEDFAASLIWEEEFVVALPVGHPLASQAEITLEQLAGVDLVAYRANSALRRRLEQAMAAKGLAPTNAFVTTEMGAVRALVAKGLGCAVLPRSIADEPGPEIVVRPVGPQVLTWPVALVWRAARRQPPAAKAFLSLALARAEEAAAADARPAVHLVA
ncbi:MAG: LysR family transcriptional regulator [Solirubrobacterales bacterium]|nr:LysR family transcriptional regulator [Solirubrobacterales bacterium]